MATNAFMVQKILADLYQAYEGMDEILMKMEISDKIHKFLSLEIKSEPKEGISHADWEAFLREVDSLPAETRTALQQALRRAQGV